VTREDDEQDIAESKRTEHGAKSQHLPRRPRSILPQGNGKTASVTNLGAIENIRFDAVPRSIRLARDKPTISELDEIYFDTFDWPMVRNAENMRSWSNGVQTLSEFFIGTRWDLRRWDVEYIRKYLIESFEYAKSPDFSTDDLELPSGVENIESLDLPDQFELIDVECFEVDGAKAFSVLSQSHRNRSTSYGINFNLLFRDCTWILQISNNAENLAEQGRDPIPIDGDPLSCIQQVARQLRESITLGWRARSLEPFENEDY
jgi:hypothetical protein